MLGTLLIAGVETALVLFWIVANADTLGTPRQQWYFEVPWAFLVLPVGAMGLAANDVAPVV